MKLVALLLIISALALPAGASNILEWKQIDVPGHNLTLNYTYSFNVTKNDFLGITIKNIGNESLNDTITINKINVSDASMAEGNWTGSVAISPNTSKTVDFDLNISTNKTVTVHIGVYYTVLSDNKKLDVIAKYPGDILEIEGKKNASILFWTPQVVDYVYVDANESKTISYSIRTAENMIEQNWTVDGKSVVGSASDNIYTYVITWDNESVGFHTVIFKGSNNDSKVEFRWYINVYEIGGYKGGNLFDVIDDALANHVMDIKIRMFKYKIAKHGGNSAIVTQKVNQLHDEIAKRQMTREALLKEFKAGNITNKEYVAALQQAQRDAKYNMKLEQEMAKITREESRKNLEKIPEKAVNDKKKDIDIVSEVKDQNKEKSLDSGNSGNGRKSGDSGNSGNSGNSGKSGDSGNSGNSGNGGKSGDSGNSGNSGKGSGNSGNKK